MSDLINPGSLQVVNGHAVTSSRIVAECFGKRHANVIRDIEELTSKSPNSVNAILR